LQESNLCSFPLVYPPVPPVPQYNTLFLVELAVMTPSFVLPPWYVLKTSKVLLIFFFFLKVRFYPLREPNRESFSFVPRPIPSLNDFSLFTPLIFPPVDHKKSFTLFFAQVVNFLKPSRVQTFLGYPEEVLPMITTRVPITHEPSSSFRPRFFRYVSAPSTSL